jgi:hypothetical protein
MGPGPWRGKGEWGAQHTANVPRPSGHESSNLSLSATFWRASPIGRAPGPNPGNARERRESPSLSPSSILKRGHDVEDAK